MIAAHVWWGDETAPQTIIPDAEGILTSVPDAPGFLEAIRKICFQVEDMMRAIAKGYRIKPT